MKARFDRQEYLAFEEVFEAGQLDDVTKELCEFSDDIEDMAYELAYTRYALAKAEARHAELSEAIHKAMERTADCDKKQTDDQLIADVAYLKRLASDYFKTSVGCGNRAFAAEQKYEALVEAVAWLREVDDTREWLMEFPWLRKWSGLDQCISEARAEVDRLIANDGAADCKGEG